MKLSKCKIMIIAAVFLMAAFLPMIQLGEVDGMDTRAPPPIASGHVTTDDTWSGEFWTDDITIDPGVTITVAAGSIWSVPQSNFIEVEGTLNISGTEASPVSVQELDSGFGWDSIKVLDHGVINFENFTMDDGFIPIRLEGGPCVIKNGVINGERHAIYSKSDGGHRFDNLDLTAVGGDSGIYLGKNKDQTEMSQITIVNSGTGVILNGCTNVNMHGIYIEKVSIGFFLADSSGLTISTCSVQGDGAADTVGFFFRGLTSDISAVDCSASKMNYGVFFTTTEGSYVDFERLYLKTDVGVANDDPADHIDANFTDCDFDDVGNNVATIGATSDTVHIGFINTTWDGAAPIQVKGESVLLVSWHVDVHVVDGNGDPLDCNVRFDAFEGHTWYDEAAPDGFAEKVIVPSVLFTDSSSPKLFNDLIITSNDVSGTQIFPQTNWWVAAYQELFLMMDLWPSSTFPASIEIDEDIPKTWDLEDYFTDPEENGLTYDIKVGSNLSLGIEGTEITVGNLVEHWNGESWLYINATDASGNWTDVNATFTILAINDAPIFTSEIPDFEIEEEGSDHFNFTGIVMDPEGDALTWNISEAVGLDLDWDEENLTLTFTGEENWFGLTGIDVNVTDGTNWTLVSIEVNVTPVNDIPVWSLMLKNGTGAPFVEYVYNETTNWTVYLIETDEDVPVEFWIDAEDVETAELLYSFVGADLLHGIIEVEMYQIEVIVNATTNETEMQNVTVPMNFTYTPLENDHLGDVVMFNVSDGEDTMSYKVWFKVAPVNDPPVFDAPLEWNTTVDLNALVTIDMADWISDVDGDTLTISTDSGYVTVNGTILEILYNDTFVDDLQNVTVTVTDGTVEITAILTVNVNQPVIGDDDDDDDDEPTLGTLEVTPEEDGWLFEVAGDEGQSLFVVIEDADGNITSYPMTYADGKYSVVIDEEDAEAGLSYHLSDVEDGESIGADTVGTLTDLAEVEGDDDPFPLWILLLIAVIVILVIIIIAVVMSRGKGEDEYDEE